MKPLRNLLFAFTFACASSWAQQSESRLIIERVECRGNVDTPCDFIRRKIQLTSGAEVESDAVKDAELRLSALPNFHSVRVYLEKGSAPGRAVLIVDVVEASSIIAELSAVYQRTSVRNRSPYGFADVDINTEIFNARLSDQNLFGRQKIGEVLVSGVHVAGD